MKKLLFLGIPIFFLFNSCDTAIKSKDKVSVEEGTELSMDIDTVQITTKDFIPDSVTNEIETIQTNPTPLTIQNKIIGSWVGYFEKDTETKFDKKTDILIDEYYWGRENKINLSIDKLNGNKVIGHNVVAGNNRPFEGTFEIDSSIVPFIYIFKTKEPGDDKYDGEFNFTISDNELIGKWKAFKKIEISKRKYKLKRKTLVYDTSVQIERSKKYINWNKSKTKTEEYGREGQDEKWIKNIYSTSTDLIYKVNASSTILKKEVVENLTKGDLKIIRNAIYARHGYSFKSRQLRFFFDAQDWYTPIHTDIRKELTDIEKSNIKLLLKYEKNAVEYYDFFGRG